LVLLSTADGSPRERGEVLYLRAVPRRDRCRDGRSSPSAARRDERGRARDGRDRRSDAEPRPHVPGPLLRRGSTSDQIVRRSPVKLHPGTSRTRPAFWQAGRPRSADLLGSPARTTPQSRQVAPGGSTYSHGVPPGRPTGSGSSASPPIGAGALAASRSWREARSRPTDVGAPATYTAITPSRSLADRRSERFTHRAGT